MWLLFRVTALLEYLDFSAQFFWEGVHLLPVHPPVWCPTNRDGSLISLHGWWSRLVSLEPAYGYFVNAVKAWLIARPECLSTAEACSCGVNITMEGRRHLGAAIGSKSFLCSTCMRKWTVGCLSNVSRLMLLIVLSSTVSLGSGLISYAPDSLVPQLPVS